MYFFCYLIVLLDLNFLFHISNASSPFCWSFHTAYSCKWVSLCLRTAALPFSEHLLSKASQKPSASAKRKKLSICSSATESDVLSFEKTHRSLQAFPTENQLVMSCDHSETITLMPSLNHNLCNREFHSENVTMPAQSADPVLPTLSAGSSFPWRNPSLQ